MRKSDEQKFNEMFEVENEQFNTDKSMFKKMKKKLYKKIFVRIIMIVCVVSVVIGIGGFTISKIVDMNHLTPDGLSFVVEKDEYASEDDYTYTQSSMELFLRCYYKMMVPGVNIYFQQEYGETFKSEGFATYRAKAYVRREGYGNEFGNADGILSIDHSYLKPDDSLNSVLSYVIGGEFKNNISEQEKDEDQRVYEQEQKEMLKRDIEELPQSAVLDVGITFNEKKPLAIIDELRNNYPNSIFRWAAVGWIIDSDEFSSSCYGIPLQPQYFRYGKDIEEYPNIYLFQVDSKNLEIYYNSVLQMMKDNKEYYEMALRSHPYESIDLLERQIKEAKDGVEIIGINATMKKDDLLDMINRDLTKYISVHDVRLSILSN